LGGVAARNGGRSQSQKKEEGCCRGEREEETMTFSGMVDADWWFWRCMVELMMKK
jgi:hypothetical protein